MQTAVLKQFAQGARKKLMAQVAGKLAAVLDKHSSARREQLSAVQSLEHAIANQGRAGIIDQVAYTWFNRFCALRFMDVVGFHPAKLKIVSPAHGASQPQLLALAKAGDLTNKLLSDQESIQQRVLALLSEATPSHDPQGEAFQLLLIAVCNSYHQKMPFLFDDINHFTQLLMPDDLLSDDSIISQTGQAMTVEHCQSVEVIGWLYQFYISEKKDEVFAAFKKNQKANADTIAAATQLFTPHWIVRYLVENSLGRLWLQNRPNSRLVAQMAYYIKPAENSASFLKIADPKEIKICDPACGSGHMLTYAFDLLFAIYLEAGYSEAEIGPHILQNNLYGTEIDSRASTLAAFALTMKAVQGNPQNDANYASRFFRKPQNFKANICQLKTIRFSEDEQKLLKKAISPKLLSPSAWQTINLFEQADELGALLTPPPPEDFSALAATLAEREANNQLNLMGDNLYAIKQKASRALQQADYLQPKYHVVIANPPYMGAKNMSAGLAEFLKKHYKEVKSDLFAAFMVRNTQLARANGQLGFMTPFVWMFISSYEKLRQFLINEKTITSLVQLEYSGFDGATVPICTFTLENGHRPDYKGGYVRLSAFKGAATQAPKTLEAIQNPDCGWFFRAAARDFNKIPGSPVAYWLSKTIIQNFQFNEALGNLVPIRGGMTTANNNKFIRYWFEVSIFNISFAGLSNHKWFPYNKGGEYRKWFGNQNWVINWKNNGQSIKETGKASVRSEELYFSEMIGWTDITSYSQLGVRYYGDNFIFDASGPSVFPDAQASYTRVLSFLASKITSIILQALNPTLHVQPGNIACLPFKEYTNSTIDLNSEDLLDIAKTDWNAFETSWDFTTLPLLDQYQSNKDQPLAATYAAIKKQWQAATIEMQKLEEENNRIFIEAYGLADELTPEVPLKEITLTCNPHYRYGHKKTAAQLAALQQTDTIKELISYGVGCLFGRYALDAPGLVLADQGATLDAYNKKIPTPVFEPDAENVLPAINLAGHWFEDDITTGVKRFIKTSLGAVNYEVNLQFIEQALGKSLHKYLTADFYTDHVRRYKKRPIYWLFSSPKKTFNALIYLHRYNKDTISVVRDQYLNQLMVKVQGQLESQQTLATCGSSTEKIRAQKTIAELNRVLTELEDYDRNLLFPLAQQQLEIDLDDGVKVNHAKFGKVLRGIQ